MAAASSSDDHELDDAELGDVRPFTAILYDDDQGGAADAETMEDGASALAAASIPLPTFANAALLPAFQMQQTAASSFKSNPDYLLHLRDNSDGLLAAASSCRAVKIYDRSLCFLNALEGHSEIITDLCFVPTVPAALLSCSEDGTLRCFDSKSNKQISQMRGVGGKSLYCCTSNGQLMVAGGEAGIFFWDIRNPQHMLGSFEELHTQDVLQVRFHPLKPSRLFSGGEDGLIAELDLLQADPDEAVESILNPQQSVGRIGFFGTQLENLYCISQINTLSLWNIAEGETLASFPNIRTDLSAHMPTDYLLDCHWDAASSSLFLASGDLSGRMLLSQLSPAGARPVRALGGAHVGMIRDLCWSNESLFTCGEDARLCSWAPPAQAGSAAAGALSFNFSMERPDVESEQAAAARKAKKFSPY